MNRFIIAVVFMAFSLLLSACSGAGILRAIGNVSPAGDHAKSADIRYGTSPRQTMDLYVPEQKSAQAKTVVFVYGGAWRSGNKREYEFVAKSLLSMGHTVLVPDYRLFPEHRYPDFINDVADAIVHCEQKLPACRPDEEPLVLMGHSAGAHSVALLATDPEILQNAGSALQVAGLIALSGPYDLPLDDPEVIPVFSGIDSESRVKPVALASADSPPTLLLHAKSDERVRYFHSERFAAALTENNVPVTLVPVKGGHVRLLLGLSRPLGFLSRSNEEVEKFLLMPLSTNRS